eukprot:2834786-Prymnesium_polylepis.1
MVQRMYGGGNLCSKALECRYFDETLRQWSTQGCNTIELEGGGLGCDCSHLSDFIAVKVPTAFTNEIEFAQVAMPETTTLHCECVSGLQ